MDPGADSWPRVARVLRALLALPSARRTTELAAFCAGEEWLQREVEALLRHEAAAERFLRAPAAPAEATSAADSAPADPLPGQRIGPYRLERRIASGGMGDVFLARRVEGGFEQRAAIKLMHAGTHTRELLRRFQQERQALAQLSHANIARLLDGGASADGRPYFAMEFVEGVSIAEYCDAHRYTVRQRLELFLKVCDAVHYAHRNLIIHRDLKPDNILTTPAGQPVLLDFGIAKFLAPEGPSAAPQTALTDARWMTPEYASPEQILGAPLTTACDVYSLGVILYELLTGHRPYRVQGPSLLEVERVVCGSEPQRPSTAVTRSLLTADGEVPNPALTPELVSARRGSTPRLLAQSLRGDLDSVILMALQKEPDRRYRGVDALADDIRRHLAGVPVLARRATWAYYAQRFLRRNRVVASAVGLGVLALLGGTATTLWQARVAARERNAEKAQRLAAETSLARAREAEQRADAQAGRALVAAQRAKRISDFLRGMLRSANPELNRPDLSLRDVLDAASARIDSALPENPEVEAELRATLGSTYSSLGLFEKAEGHLRRALELRESSADVADHDVASVLNDLGLVQKAQGDLPAAASSLSRSLALFERGDGAEAPEVSSAMNNLAIVLKAQGNLTEAESLLRHALTLKSERSEAGSTSSAGTLHNLAEILLDRGQLAEAEALYRQALQLSRASNGEDNLDVATILDSLSITRKRQGDLAEAETLAQQALEIRRARLAPDHPALGNSLHNLAKIRVARQDYEGAEGLFGEALDIFRKAHGEEHSSVATVLDGIGLSLMHRGELEGATAVLRDSLAIRKKVLGPRHREVAFGLGNLATVLKRQAHFEEAEPLCREALGILRELYGESHPDVATGLGNLSLLLEAKGDPAGAAQACREQVSVLRMLPTAGPALAAKALGRLATLCRELQRWQEAADAFAELAQLCRERTPPAEAEAAQAERDRDECLRHLH